MNIDFLPRPLDVGELERTEKAIRERREENTKGWGDLGERVDRELVDEGREREQENHRREEERIHELLAEGKSLEEAEELLSLEDRELEKSNL